MKIKISLEFGDMILVVNYKPIAPYDLWLMNKDGEGMEISSKEIEKILTKYMAEHF